MINLLPEERKEQIRSARINVILAFYTGVVIMAAVFLGTVLFVSYSVLETTKSSADAIVADNDLKADVYSGTQSAVDTLRSNLSQAKSVINQEVKYSSVLTTLGSLMPTGTIIGSLNLTSSNFNGVQITLKVYAKTDEAVNKLSANFKSSSLFSQVDVGQSESSTDIADYPKNINVMVVFNPEAGK